MLYKNRNHYLLFTKKKIPIRINCQLKPLICLNTD